ncbi:hypothetical protein [Edaphosphingomonas haloaromaticamans]|uniref:Uncharacterized protein n=1 Tax=Edaphosphingomonas haloaromaticamans TaxID=653954 RepID=A0A1S1HHS5_9SPHN|nr:hypothetical protein [Sphingomonas haloaromaticamans]OHT21627.1 hypothetical protein BHE75_03638 [Sphingomonas haloaromaticamans]
MSRDKRAAIPAAPRNTLLQWIGSDDGDTTDFSPPACNTNIQALHARMLLDPEKTSEGRPEPLEPPPSLGLPPLG